MEDLSTSTQYMIVSLCICVIRLLIRVISRRFKEDQKKEATGPANFGGQSKERRSEHERPSQKKVHPGYEDHGNLNKHQRVKKRDTGKDETGSE